MAKSFGIIKNMDQIKSSPKDVFTHILSIIMLYTAAGSFIALIFQYINLLFPDPLEGGYYYSFASTIRWSMASLIVVFPALLFVMRMLAQDYAKHPEHKELRIRKWLVYFTLFAAAIIIGGDLISLIYNFLEGDLTTRFALKILTIFVVAGMIFYYYLRDLREGWRGTTLKFLAYGTAIVVFAGILVGFFTAGSPFVARMRKFDDRRVGDLQMIQGEIIHYWTQKGKLPAAVSDLRNSISGFAAPADPKSGAAYEYKINSELSFDLCASFELSLAADPTGVGVTYPKVAPYEPYGPYGRYGENWDHGTGRACFNRVIDPQLYKPQKLENRI